MNSINLVGRICNELELKHTASDIAVCSFTVAVKRPRSTDKTDFLDCTAFRHSAEYISRYGSKGDTVAVNGIMTTRKYTDNNGNKRTAYEIIVNDLNLVQNRMKGSEDIPTPAEQKPQEEPKEAKTEAYEEVSFGDDLPFN